MLWRTDELSARSHRRKKGVDDVERHPRSDHLAEERRKASPPAAAAPDLGDDETQPRRGGDANSEKQRVAQLPGDVVAADGEEQRRVADELDEHQRPDSVREEVDRGLERSVERQQIELRAGGIEPQPMRNDVGAEVDRLLGAIGVDGHGQLLGDDQVFQEDRLPASQLRAIAQVEVLRQGVRGPAAGIVDRCPAPHSRRPGEVDEVTSRRAHGLLDQEVKVDEQRLEAREP